ncbi:unnamed protein product [Lupinus luteus]|uniref:Peptidase A1 domain-containing protein n=1 Tax=Lupinus luteus TaxID=3873 RepID=A0AAV1WZD2_LUPLU
MLTQQSDARAQHLSNMISSSLHPNRTKYSLEHDTIPMPVIKRVRSTTMVVEVGIGTFNDGSYKSYLLTIDTGSTHIWIQCEDCRLKPKGHCYPQKDDYFPNSKSKSYIPLNPPSPYNLTYGDGSNSSGFRAKETFTFPSTSPSFPHLKLPNIIFGCGTNNHNSFSRDNNFPIAGIFGLGMDERFGTNIRPPPKSKTIKFLQSSTSHYFVNLVDLGVNGERLHINEKILNSPDKTHKGIAIDSGAATSYISKGAYDILIKKLDNHFLKHKGEFKKEIHQQWFMYSRIKGSGFNNVPGVIFYFEGGAQLDVNPEDTFMRITLRGSSEALALAIRQTAVGFNILGAFQQVNYKFIYNIKDKTLQFGQEDCSKNG